MQPRNKGFTLIELLVVVLIIAILAAIALPRYTRIIAKTRMTEMIMLGSRLHEALKEYYLVHGQYTLYLSDLSIDDIICPPSESPEPTCNYGKLSIQTGSSNISGGYWMKIYIRDIPRNKFPTLELYNVKRFECLTNGSESNVEICKIFGGRTRPNTPNYYYIDNF